MDSDLIADPLVVSATRSARNVNDVPASVMLVSREQAAAMPVQSTDPLLREVLSLVPELVEPYRGHPTSSLVSLCGLKSRVTPHVLAMVDSVPINDSFFLIPAETVMRCSS